MHNVPQYDSYDNALNVFTALGESNLSILCLYFLKEKCHQIITNTRSNN